MRALFSFFIKKKKKRQENQPFVFERGESHCNHTKFCFQIIKRESSEVFTILVVFVTYYCLSYFFPSIVISLLMSCEEGMVPLLSDCFVYCLFLEMAIFSQTFNDISTSLHPFPSSAPHTLQYCRFELLKKPLRCQQEEVAV